METIYEMLEREYQEILKDKDTPADQLKASVAQYMDNDGWFPDSILGNSIWVLSYCIKEDRNGELYWKFADKYSD